MAIWCDLSFAIMSYSILVFVLSKLTGFNQVDSWQKSKSIANSVAFNRETPSNGLSSFALHDSLIFLLSYAVVLVGQTSSYVGVMNEFLKMYSVSCIEPLKPFHNDGSCGGI